MRACCVKAVSAVALLALPAMLGQPRAQSLGDARRFEPVVIKHRQMPIYQDLPMDQVYLCAYHEASGTWSVMPFQIDEVYNTTDPCKPQEGVGPRDFYVQVGSANVVREDANPAFDPDDELVFLVGDMGDQAPAEEWIDDVDARRHRRFEIVATDPTDPGRRWYAYLYQSATLGAQVPTPYGFAFDPVQQVVETAMYRVRVNTSNGVLEDVAIKPPYGTGVDFFDTQKIRFTGYLDFFGLLQITVGIGGTPAANERDNLHLYGPSEPERYYFGYTARPVVRLVRTVRQTIKFGSWKLHEVAFYVKCFFYPFGGTVEGGADLDPQKLKEAFHTEDDILIDMEMLRQSWDLNSNATGMRFFNRYNEGVLIDGVPDAVNSTIQLPIREWSLFSGPQGSLFTHVTFRDTTWESISLYYYDQKLGGVGDGTAGGDTGDGVSYGDSGILFRNLGQDSVSLQLGFVAYFLPGNLSRVDGERLAEVVAHPVAVTVQGMSFGSGVDEAGSQAPSDFRLCGVFPNPARGQLALRFQLARPAEVVLSIVDVAGREVVVLVQDSFGAGLHQVCWHGTDSLGRRVPSGLYFGRLRVAGRVSVAKLLLME